MKMSDASQDDVVHEGGCLCGAVRYRTTGAPNDINVCYCTQCQRQTGSPLPAFANFNRDRVELVKGEVGGYRASDFGTRQFCPHCGSAMFWMQDGSDRMSVHLGTFDDPSDFPSPSYEIWTAHRVKWLDNIPGADSFPGDN
jgi:hypothetical protein